MVHLVDIFRSAKVEYPPPPIIVSKLLKTFLLYHKIFRYIFFYICFLSLFSGLRMIFFNSHPEQNLFLVETCGYCLFCLRNRSQLLLSAYETFA